MAGFTIARRGLTERLEGSGTVRASVTKEAPVNIAHPAFGGVDLTGDSVTPSASVAAAIAFAATGSQAGGVGELFIPAGLLKLNARAQFSTLQGIKVFGEGKLATVVQQTTDGEPIFEWTAHQGTPHITLADMQLIYANQQTVASNPESAAINLLNDNTGGASGFYLSTFRQLLISKACYGIRWKPTSPATWVSFWNNHIEDVEMGNISGSLLSNALTSGSIGQPTNQIDRLTHLGGSVTPTGIALNLGAGGEWVFNSLDIEDWTNTLLNATGSSKVSINGMHIERHHLVANSTSVFNVSGSAGDFRNIHGSYNRDGTGPYFLFNFNTAAFGHVGNVDSFDGSGIGSGTLRHFNVSSDSQVTLGPRVSHNANIVDWLASESTILQGVYSDKGLPPIWDSSVALPTASSTYRGRMFYVKGTNASTADTLQVCMQSVTGTYSWKTIATG